MFKVGDKVRVKPLEDHIGEVISVQSDGRLVVTYGTVTLRAAPNEVEKIDPPGTDPQSIPPNTHLSQPPLNI